MGLVAARARRAPRCSTGAWPGSPLRARLWSGWLAGLGCYAIGLAWARAFNWYGAVVLVLVEALFFAAAAARTPPGAGGRPAFVGACTLAEALRMTWPFGGLPLGGVFLGQARGPLVELARLGGPLLITAGVWAGGVALATLRHRRLGAAHGRFGGPSVVGAAASSPGLVALAVVGTLAPDGGPPVRTLRVALVQGGGQRGLSKQEVPPASVFAAQLAATSARGLGRPCPGSCCGPRTSWRSTARWPARPRRPLLSRLAGGSARRCSSA